MTATTLAALRAVNISPKNSTEARNAKRQLLELIMVLLVTLVRASDLAGQLFEFGQTTAIRACPLSFLLGSGFTGCKIATQCWVMPLARPPTGSSACWLRP
jgi:hypothetical protein